MNQYQLDLDRLNRQQQAPARRLTPITAKEYLEMTKNQNIKAITQSAYEKQQGSIGQDKIAKTQLNQVYQNAIRGSQQQMNYAGLGGTGYSETSQANLQNAYMGGVNELNLERQKRDTTILNEYRGGIANEEVKMAQQLAEQQQLQEQEQAKQLSANIVGWKNQIINLGNSADIEGVKKYLKSVLNYGGLTKEQFNMLMQDTDIRYIIDVLGINPDKL